MTFATPLLAGIAAVVGVSTFAGCHINHAKINSSMTPERVEERLRDRVEYSMSRDEARRAMRRGGLYEVVETDDAQYYPLEIQSGIYVLALEQSGMLALDFDAASGLVGARYWNWLNPQVEPSTTKLPTHVFDLSEVTP
ncbi:MAG: hypothetical protein AAFR38_02485 [Planctomycetota bacterium]